MIPFFITGTGDYGFLGLEYCLVPLLAALDVVCCGQCHEAAATIGMQHSSQFGLRLAFRIL